MSNESGKGKAKRGDSGQKSDGKTSAQKAAEHDRNFGKASDHMTVYYDNDHQAEKRGQS